MDSKVNLKSDFHTKIIKSFLVILLSLLSLSCSDDYKFEYDNPADPYSDNYVPAAPDFLMVTASSDTGITLIWKSQSSSEEGFKVFRKIGNYELYKQIAQLAPGTTSYFDTIAVSAGLTYYYKIASFNKNTRANYSVEKTFMLDYLVPPKISFVFKENTSVELYLKYDEQMATKIRVEKSVNGGAFSILTELSNKIFDYKDENIDTTNYYSYRTKIFTKNNESVYSESFIITYAVSDLKKIKQVNLGQPVHTINFSSDGTKVAASGMSYAIRVWNLSDLSLVADFSYKGGNVTSAGYPFPATISRDGVLLASATDANIDGAIIKIWNLNTGTLYSSIQGTGDNPASSMCFSNDGKKLFTGDFYGNLISWNVENGKQLKKIYITHAGSVNFLYSTSDGRNVIAGIKGSTSNINEGIQVRDSEQFSLIRSYKGFEGGYSVSPNENFFTWEGNVTKFENGNVISSIPVVPYSQSCFSYDNNLLLTREYWGGIKASTINNIKFSISKNIGYPDNYTYPVIASSPISNLFAISGTRSGYIEFWSIIREWKNY